MAVKTIREMHQHWARLTMPKWASPVQRQETERAFYSGAFAFFTLQIADIAALPDDEAEKALQSARQELEDYFNLLRTIPGPEGAARQ